VLTLHLKQKQKNRPIPAGGLAKNLRSTQRALASEAENPGSFATDKQSASSGRPIGFAAAGRGLCLAPRMSRANSNRTSPPSRSETLRYLTDFFLYVNTLCR